MPQLFNLGGLQVQSLNELRINKLMSEDAANTFFEYDSANTKFEMNLDQITNNYLPVYACRAWVNFNGILAMSVGFSYGPDAPPADFSSPNPIRASGNVSSITDRGLGRYRVNFLTAMVDVNYSGVISVSADPQGGPSFGSFAGHTNYGSLPSTTTFDVMANNDGGGYYDKYYVMVAIFR